MFLPYSYIEYWTYHSLDARLYMNIVAFNLIITHGVFSLLTFLMFFSLGRYSTIDSFNMETIINTLSKKLDKEIKFNVIGMRPGEKFHEDMIAQTELPFTYESKFLDGFTTDHCNRLLCVIPQFTNKEYPFEKYDGPEFNSSMFLNYDTNYLLKLINKGLQDAN